MTKHTKYISPAQRRKNREARNGLALIAVCLFGFASLFYAAYSVDKANGVGVSESLASQGI